jgi:hypothetical protein
MYGVRRLTEQNLTTLVLSATKYAKSSTRCATFVSLCGLAVDPFPQGDAEIASALYVELREEVSVARDAWIGTSANPYLGSEGVLFCPLPAALKVVTHLFEHIRSLHAETYDAMVAAIERSAEGPAPRPGRAPPCLSSMWTRRWRWCSRTGRPGGSCCANRWRCSSRRETSTTTACSPSTSSSTSCA